MSTTTTARHALRDDHGNVVFDWARECPEYTPTIHVPTDVRTVIYAGANRLAKAGAR